MLCVLQVMDFLLVVVHLCLIMSGDVELNPGPVYYAHIWYKRGRYLNLSLMNALLVQNLQRDGQVTSDITRSLYCKSDNFHVEVCVI